LRRIWVLRLSSVFKTVLSGLLILSVPIAVVMVFAKLSQLESCLVLELETWHIFPEYMTFLGFLNQLLGITDTNAWETSAIIDFIFLGQDAQMTETEALQRDFILQTIYLEAIGKWGWNGLIFMVNLGSNGWQRLFVIEDTSTSRKAREGDRLSSDRKQRPRYDALRKLSRRTGGGVAVPDDVEMDDQGLLHQPPVQYINTKAGSTTVNTPTQVMILNDYSRPLRGRIEPLNPPQAPDRPCCPGAPPGSGAAPEAAVTIAPVRAAENVWHTAPGQMAVVSDAVGSGQPYRLIVIVGDIGGDGRDAHVVLPFTTPIRGDVQLRLRAILNAEPIKFGRIERRKTAVCKVWNNCLPEIPRRNASQGTDVAQQRAEHEAKQY